MPASVTTLTDISNIYWNQLKRMKKAAQTVTETTFIDVLNENDVLSGRGRAVNSYPGNLKFRSFVNEYRSQFLGRSNTKEKRTICETVLEEVRSQKPSGRFVKMISVQGDNPGEEPECKWIDIGHAKAIEKINQALREISARLKAVHDTKKRKVDTDSEQSYKKVRSVHTDSYSEKSFNKSRTPQSEKLLNQPEHVLSQEGIDPRREKLLSHPEHVPSQEGIDPRREKLLSHSHNVPRQEEINPRRDSTLIPMRVGNCSSQHLPHENN